MRLTRWRRPAFVLLIACVVSLGLFAGRVRILGALGAGLVAEDPLVSADVIVVTIDAGASGMLEAADLVHAGIATRVVIFAEPSDAVDAEFIRRGFHVERQSAIWRRMLAELGVPAVEEIPIPVSGTEAEGILLPRWCEQHHLESMIVVTSPDHSRRVRRVLNRRSACRGARIGVRPARVSTFDPETWWRTRGGLRTGVVEMQKLLLDVLRHPIS